MEFLAVVGAAVLGYGAYWLYKFIKGFRKI